jgi:hypothetical protein
MSLTSLKGMYVGEYVVGGNIAHQWYCNQSSIEFDIWTDVETGHPVQVFVPLKAPLGGEGENLFFFFGDIHSKGN